MACADDIRGVFGPDNGWPAKDMTLADNLSDLNRHEREFLAREAFAYSIFERSRARRYVGCVYIKPIKSRVEDDRRKALFNAQAFCWFSPVVTDREFATLAADEFVQWVKTSWPFTKVAFPGQTIGWNEWYALACEQDRSPRMLNMYKTGFGPIAVTHRLFWPRSRNVRSASTCLALRPLGAAKRKRLFIRAARKETAL